jgi:hypothetical protein
MINSKNLIEVLGKNEERAKSELLNSQVTTKSPMGAIIYETGGILIKNGWLRILGSGSPKLNRGLMEWNKGKTFVHIGEKPSFLLIADDVIGGFYAINGGGLSKQDVGKVFYFAPDTFEWESLEINYSEFIYFAFHNDLEKFYENFFWDGWENDLPKIDGNKAMSFYPFLWTEESKDINKCERSIVPISELWDITIEIKRQM